MKLILLVLSICYFFGTASAQFNCTNFCSERGVCNFDGSCDCFPGYYTADCSKTVLDYIEALYTAFEIYVIILSCVIVIGSSAVLIYARIAKLKYNANSKAIGFFNIKTALLLALICLSIDMILYFSIDAGPGFKHRVHIFVPTLIFGLILSFLSLVFCIMLFHWAEVYYSTMQILHREEMLEKINTRYKSNVTLEDVLKNVKVINRLKIPFGLVSVISFLVSIFNATIACFFPIHAYPFRIFWAVYFSVMFFGYSLGFLIFGRRLMSVMPTPLQKKMRRITNMLSFVSIVYLFVWIFDFVMFTWVVGSPGIYIFADFVGFTAVMLIEFALLSMFIKFVPRFPFVSFGDEKSSQMSSSHGESNTVPMSSTSNQDSVEVEVDSEEKPGEPESVSSA